MPTDLLLSGWLAGGGRAGHRALRCRSADPISGLMTSLLLSVADVKHQRRIGARRLRVAVSDGARNAELHPALKPDRGPQEKLQPGADQAAGLHSVRDLSQTAGTATRASSRKEQQHHSGQNEQPNGLPPSFAEPSPTHIERPKDRTAPSRGRVPRAAYALPRRRRRPAQLAPDDGASRLGEVALVDDTSPLQRSGFLFYDRLLDESAASHIAWGDGIPDGHLDYDPLQPETLDDLPINPRPPTSTS